MYRIIKTEKIANLVQFTSGNTKLDNGLFERQLIPNLEEYRTLVYLVGRAWGLKHGLFFQINERLKLNIHSKVHILFPTYGSFFAQKDKFTGKHNSSSRTVTFPNSVLHYSCFDNFKSITAPLTIVCCADKFKDFQTFHKNYLVINYLNIHSSKLILTANTFTEDIKKIVNKSDTLTVTGSTFENITLSDELLSNYIDNTDLILNSFTDNEKSI